MKSIQISTDSAGFCGCAYVPEAFCGTAVIVVTGSDGGIDNAKHIAGLFVEQGMLALAVGYFGLPGLPKTLSMIPLETIEWAVRWLKAYEGGRVRSICAYGLSKGAEMVLLSSIYSRDIDSVVAVVPNCFVGEGIRPGLPFYTRQSSWTIRGEALPFAPMQLDVGAFLRASLRGREIHSSAFYECAIARGIPESAWIPVEASGADLLLLSAGEDSMWPSQWACERMIERLTQAKYGKAFRHVCFSSASHLLSPMRDKKAKRMGMVMRVERRQPEACQRAREEAFSRSVQWALRNRKDVADR